MRTNPNVRYFDDYTLGQTFDTDGITIEQSDIMQFAGLSGDYNPIHTNEEYARSTRFGGRISHGMLAVSKMTGKFNQLGYWDGAVIAMLETGWKFLQVVRPGDTIYAHLTIAELKESKGKDCGSVTIRFDVMNQDEINVFEGFLKLLLKKRS
jgi:acyl dehydratase